MDITAAICTYNNWASLAKTLESFIRLQMGAGIKWELLIVDNNSCDDTKRVCQKYSCLLPLRYVFEPRQGLTHARKRAVIEGAGEMIAFVDDDCIVSPTWLQEAVAFCRSHPMAGAVGGKVSLLWEEPPNETVVRYENYLAKQDHGPAPLRLPSEGFTFLVGAGLVVRRPALEASQWMHRAVLSDRRGNGMTSCGDIEIVLRIRNAGYELWYNPAMEMQHCIPRRRMSVPYLCRLLRGTGQSSIFVYELARKGPSTRTDRRRTLHHYLREFVGVLKSVAGDLCYHGKITPKKRITAYQYFGFLEGAIRHMYEREP
jgi:glycosyltransferase involved in cell wall biosynthesis